ncbi:MAG: hypothetical protein LQ340_001185 [Diploschistes diacapsis]|nr:MAG: hypothetical protein LQ340_001185 [Diploschistes diacapsis]
MAVTSTSASKSRQGQLPYWCVNVPPHEWPEECPDYLRHQSEKDQEILATPDSEYRRLTWDEVKSLIGLAGNNRLDLFHRVPSDLRLYRKYVYTLNREYGSIMNFVLWERLKWEDIRPSNAAPFTNPEVRADGAIPEDLKILPNDWPYGVDQDIVHIIVWTKFRFDEDPNTGDLTPTARQQIDDFINRTFRCRVGKENVQWFRNWASIKSVKAVEHFHVMLYRPKREFVEEITGGVEPQRSISVLKA